MGGLLKRALVPIALACFLTPAAAWAPETRVAMIDEALRLMPESLRKALGNHREELLRGMLEPMVAEDGPDHRPSWAAGRLEAAVEREAEALAETLSQRNSFKEIARNLGSVAHFVADAGFPPGATRTDGSERFAHFAWFCEDRRGRFPTVFYGHDDAVLTDGEWSSFALRELERASQDDVQLGRAYRAAGDPPDMAAFGDRSVPFAVGSLAYSRTITNIVRIWLAIWQRAGGDMARIPYWGTAAPDGS